MNVPERRQLQRMIPRRLVYIDIKPDNGGIVLNVSDEGLCFQSAAPIQHHQPLAFSFFEQNRSSHALGEVVWMDDTQKFGGLRFSSLTSEARGKIDELLKMVSSDEQDQFTMQSSPCLADVNEATMASLAVQNEQASPSELCLVDEVSSVPAGHFDDISVSGDSSEVAVDQLKPIGRSSMVGFSRALAIPLLISAVGFAIVLTHHIFHGGFHGNSLAGSEQPLAPQSKVSTHSAASLPQAVTSSFRIASQASSPRHIHFSGAIADGLRAKKRLDNVVVRNTAHSLTQPSAKERPRITVAPLRFEYPVADDPALSGKVGLKLLIGITGSVQGVSVLTGKRILADASVKAVRRWRYRPFALDGHPVEAEANVTISFMGDDAVSIDFNE